MKQNRFLNILIPTLKILLLIILVFSFLYYTVGLIESYVSDLHKEPMENEISLDAFPIFYVFVLIFSVITNGISLLLSVVGLVVSHLYRASLKRKRHMLHFTLLLCASVVLELIYFTVGLAAGLF